MRIEINGKEDCLQYHEMVIFWPETGFALRDIGFAVPELGFALP